MTVDGENEGQATSTEAEESRVFKRTIDLVEKSSFAVVNYLLRKSVSKVSASWKAMGLTRYPCIIRSTVVTTGRGGRSASDNDYRAIFETYLQDQIAVLYMPEWPVASLSLTVSAKLMVSKLTYVMSAILTMIALALQMRALEETRSSPEVTIGRAIAIEHLGALATRLRSFTVQQQIDGHHAAQPLPLVSIRRHFTRSAS